MNFRTFTIFSTIPPAHMRCILAHLGYQEIHLDNQGASEMWLSLQNLQKFTKLMARYILQDMINCLNMFSFKDRISSNLISAAIILGSPNPYYNKLNITFGVNAYVYIGTNNITKQRTVGAIALIP